MPYIIRRSGKKHCVYNKDTGKLIPGGCHDEAGDALAHMRALYANVEDAKKKGK